MARLRATNARHASPQRSKGNGNEKAKWILVHVSHARLHVQSTKHEEPGLVFCTYRFVLVSKGTQFYTYNFCIVLLCTWNE